MMECSMPAHCCFWRVVHLVRACLMHQLVRCCSSAYTSSVIDCFLRSCKVVHSSCSIRPLLTDEVLWHRLVTYRAALLWTISNRWRSFCCHGSHTELAYSRVGRRFITWFQIKYIGVLSIDAYSYSSNVFPHKMISLYIS